MVGIRDQQPTELIPGMVDKTIYGRPGFPGLPLCMGADMADYKILRAEDKPEADVVHERVDQVIQDLAGNRIAPRKVDALRDAVDRTRSDSGVFRAIR